LYLTRALAAYRPPISAIMLRLRLEASAIQRPAWEVAQHGQRLLLSMQRSSSTAGPRYERRATEFSDWLN
jgi:hypothetical protein